MGKIGGDMAEPRPQEHPAPASERPAATPPAGPPEPPSREEAVQHIRWVGKSGESSKTAKRSR